MTENEIIEICKKYKIKNYTINSDMSIDVDDNIDPIDRQLEKLPVKFGKVTGWFDCSGMSLTTLEGFPEYINKHLILNNMKQLANLKFFPSYVGSNVFMGNTDYIPNYEYRWLFFSYIGGLICVSNSKLNIFLNDNKNPPKKDLPKILSELKKL